MKEINKYPPQPDTSSTIKKRDSSIDQAAGLMLLCVVVGHALNWCSLSDSVFWTTIQFLFFYRMPWFFYKAGMFGKKRDLGTEFKIGINKLIIPYIGFFIISTIVYFIRFYVENENLDFMTLLKIVIFNLFISGSAPGNSAIWFLLAMFFSKLMYVYLSKHFNHNVIVIGAITVLMVNFYLRQSFPDSILLKWPEYIYCSISALLFYTIGSLMKGKKIDYKILVPALIAYVSIALFSFSYVDMHHNQLISGWYILWIPASFFGILLLNAAFKYTSRFYLFKTLEYIGNNSFAIFATHFIIGNIVWLTFIYPLNIHDSFVQFSIYIVSFVVLLPIASRLLQKGWANFLIGKRDFI